MIGILIAILSIRYVNIIEGYPSVSHFDAVVLFTDVFRSLRTPG